MKTQWIVLADASRARVISTVDRAQHLRLKYELVHPESRPRAQELVSDESGRVDKGGRGILSAMDPPTDSHEEQARRFAGQLAEVVDEGLAHKAFQGLTLVAPAHFLGLLKMALSAQVNKRLDACVVKDLTRLSLQELCDRLPEILEQQTTLSLWQLMHRLHRGAVRMRHPFKPGERQ